MLYILQILITLVVFIANTAIAKTTLTETDFDIEIFVVAHMADERANQTWSLLQLSKDISQELEIEQFQKSRFF